MALFDDAGRAALLADDGVADDVGPPRRPYPRPRARRLGSREDLDRLTLHNG